MATPNSINLFDQEPEQEKKGAARTAFMLGALVALGVAGALGVGFVLGSASDDGNDGDVRGASSEPTRVVRVSPTDGNPQAGGETEPQAPAGNTHPTGSGSGSGTGSGAGASSGSGSSGGGEGSAPVPTNTPEPPAPTSTPVPPTETPTNTPTSTPTATATPSGDPCPWCPDLDLVDPGIIFDPGLVIVDIWPPEFDYANAMNCPGGTLVSASVNEQAEMWVTHIVFGFIASESPHQLGSSALDINIGGGPFIFPATDVVVHARDVAGNESSMAVNWLDCI